MDRMLKSLAAAMGRRGALRSLGVAGMLSLVATGLSDVSAKGPPNDGRGRMQTERRRKKKGKTKRGPTGPAGPAGPTGPAGPGERKTRNVISATSAPLGVAAGSRVIAFADCGGAGKVVMCGYQTDGSPDAFVNVFVSGMDSISDLSSCSASLFRTSEAGSSPGAVIQATAVCLD
jgi:hypothetical protein